MRCSKIVISKSELIVFILMLLNLFICAPSMMSDKYQKILLVITCLLMINLLVGILLDIYYYKKKYTKINGDITVEEIMKAYNSGEVNYDYNGCNIQLTGEVKSITISNKNNFMDGINVRIVFLNSKDYTISAEIKNTSRRCIKYIRKLSENDKLTLVGELNEENNELKLLAGYLKN